MMPMAPILAHVHPSAERTARTLSACLRQIKPPFWRWRLPTSVTASPLFWIGLSSAISFLLTYRLFFLPMVSDEGGYAFAAERWFDGRGALYYDLWISRPQGIFLIYGAVIEWLGGSTSDLRFVAWGVNVLTMITVWVIACRWRGPRIAAGATLFFGLMMGSPAIEGFTANAEIFMALPAAISILTLMRAHSRNWGAGWLALTGLLTGISTQLKPSGIVMVAVACLFVALMAWDSERFVRTVSTRMGMVMAGFGLSLAPALYHGYLVGWDAFVYASVTFRLTRQSSATSSLAHHLSALGELSSRIWPIYVVVALVLVARYLTAPAKPAIASAPVRKLRLQPAPPVGIVSVSQMTAITSDPVRLLVQIWIVGCLVGISMGGDWWNHYVIQLAAPFAIWLAVSLTDLRGRLARGMHVALASTVAVMLLVPYGVLASDSRAEATMTLFGHPGYADQEAVAEYIQDHTPPETPIFVAFDQAALYYLADRPSPYRYLFDQELRALPEAQGDLIAMVESSERPYYIVGTRQLAPFADRGLSFWEAVQRHYVLETVVRGVPIYRAKAELPLPLVP